MATEIEYEKTYLLKRLPEGIENAASVTIRDTYIPVTANHANLRLRAKNDTFVLTKKTPVNNGDSSVQYEHTIVLTKDEYDAIASCSTKDFVKRRYFMKIAGRDAEIDVYGEKLQGLAVIDFEFATEEEKDAFVMPDICLADVTQEEAIAGGYIAGKSYEDIAVVLQKYGYRKLEDEAWHS